MHRVQSAPLSGTIQHINFKVFIGRTHEINQLIAGLTDIAPATICVEGPTNIGASSLINQFLNAPRLYKEVWQDYVEEKEMEFKISRFDCSTKTIVDIIDAIYDEVVGFHTDDLYSLRPEPEICRQIIKRTLQSQQIRYIICLPNFEETLKKATTEDEPDFKFLTSLMDYQSFVFTIDRPIQEFPFLAGIKHISTLRLGLLTRDEARSYLETTFFASRKANYLPAEDKDLLIELSGCHPYLLYQIAETYYILCTRNPSIYEVNMDEKRLEMVRGDLSSELHTAGNLRKVYDFFRMIWNGLKSEEIDWLKKMIINPEGVEYSPDLERVISNLSFQALISYDSTTKKFSIASGLFSDYLQVNELPSGEEAGFGPDEITTRGTTNKEDLLYKLFVSNPNKVISNEMICQVVYGKQLSGKADVHKISTLIGRLRNRISDQSRGSRTDLIRSVYGEGFIYNPPASR